MLGRNQRIMEVKTILKVPSEISKIMTMHDGGLRLFIDTQELMPEDKAKVMELHRKIGWFIFADQPIEEADIKDLPKIQLEEGEKSPSARLRAVLFVYWETNKIAEPFDIFYRRKIEDFISVIKDKLP